jgi:hypothetical protein
VYFTIRSASRPYCPFDSNFPSGRTRMIYYFIRICRLLQGVCIHAAGCIGRQLVAQLVLRRISHSSGTGDLGHHLPRGLGLGSKICMISPQTRICFAEILSTISPSSNIGCIFGGKQASLLQEKSYFGQEEIVGPLGQMLLIHYSCIA